MSLCLELQEMVAAGVRVGLAGKRLRLSGLPPSGRARDHLVEIAQRHQDTLLSFLGSQAIPTPPVWMRCTRCQCEWKTYSRKTCQCVALVEPVRPEWWESDPLISRMVGEGSSIDDALAVAERLAISESPRLRGAP